MDINLSLSAAPGITTNYLVVAIYEATAPNTVFASQAFAPPHASPRNIVFPNVSDVAHQVVVYESPNSTPTGTVRHNFFYQPGFTGAKTRDDLFLTAGVTSGFPAGATSYTDASLIGWKYDVERRGYGTMQPTADISFNDTTGSFNLIAAGDQAQSGEQFILHFQPQITTVAAPSNSGGNGVLFSDEVLITDDIALDATAIGKMHLIQGTGDHLTITLPDLNGVAAMKLIGFLSEGGNHINATIQAFGSDNILFMGNTAEVFMGQGSESIWFYKKSGEWRVLNPVGNFKTVGEIVHTHFKDEFDCVFANGSAKSKAANARLWDYVKNKLANSELVSDADWNDVSKNLKGKYADIDANNFRVPLLYAPGFLRGVDGSTHKPGDGQLMDTKYDDTGGQDDGNLSDGDVTGLSYAAGAARFRVRHRGTETRPANTGVYLLIRS